MSENALTPGSAVWNYIKNSVPAQFGAAGHLAQSVAQPFTNLFGNGGQEFWNGPQDPQAAHDMSNALMTMYAGNAFNPAATVENGLGAGIKAFHGSPYDFDRFDASKIGTGEGAQAYGHGLYFAENEGVARGYRDTLSAPIRKRIDPNSLDPQDIAVAFHRNLGARGGAMHAEKMAANHPDQADAYLKAAEIMRSGDPYAGVSPGKMYEVNINADPASFLDWDKPIHEQPSPVQKYFAGKEPPSGQEWRGSDLIGGRPPGSGSAIESELSQAGIPGIRYLDQGSRVTQSDHDLLKSWSDRLGRLENEPTQRPDDIAFTKDKIAQFQNKIAAPPTHNYVVFPGNEHLIEIVKKYGLAGAATMLGLSQSDLHSAVFDNAQQHQNALAR